jgi:hypothetical protein
MSAFHLFPAICPSAPASYDSFCNLNGGVSLPSGVPLYFFDLHNDVDALDQEGVELPDLDSALARGLCETRSMIQASVAETGRIDLRHHIDIRDEKGTIVYVMHLEDVVTVQGGETMLSRASGVRSI